MRLSCTVVGEIVLPCPAETAADMVRERRGTRVLVGLLLTNG